MALRLISGYHFVSGRPSENDIEPYVKIIIHGHPTDHKVWCSKTSQMSGVNHLWNEVAEFNILHPENAVIEFSVSIWLKKNMKIQ